MRCPIIAANWKMHNTRPQARELVAALLPQIEGVEGVEVVLAPPFTALATVAEAVQGTAVKLAAQNMHWEDKGAYTAEVSPLMLVEIGCRYVILGHSERRHIFGETDRMVNHKVKAAIKHGLRPILCVGEKLEDRLAGETIVVVERQLEQGLLEITAAQTQDLVIAYEPVWAIGTGHTATPEQANTAHTVMRNWLEQRFGKLAAEDIRIQYGGSVKPSNVDNLMAEADIDGALVGGAGLKADDFARIVKFKAL